MERKQFLPLSGRSGHCGVLRATGISAPDAQKTALKQQILISLSPFPTGEARTNTLMETLRTGLCSSRVHDVGRAICGCKSNKRDGRRGLGASEALPPRRGGDGTIPIGSTAIDAVIKGWQCSTRAEDPSPAEKPWLC